MALIFVPKIVFIRKHAHDPREKEDDEQENKEQEKQYKTILKDNENMQEKIKEVIKNVVIANVEGWPNNLVGLSKKKLWTGRFWLPLCTCMRRELQRKKERALSPGF